MPRKSTDSNAELFAQFQAFLAMREAAESSDSADSTPAKPARKTTRSSGKRPEATTANRTATRTTTPARKTPKGVITCGEAWKALGADPTYTPSNPSAPARNAQLWALNAQGKLRLA